MQATMMEPVNTRLMQDNRRKEMRIAQLEKENRALKELVHSYRKDHAARYERNAKKERWHIENLEYLVAGAVIITMMFGAVWSLYSIFTCLWGWAC